ncbi:MAG: MFS transporter [Pseudomonadota bacterium]|nr:MFS transporter [Pseudomonadota bacterium]
MTSATKGLKSSVLKNFPNIGWVMFWITSGFYFYDFSLRLIPSVMLEEITATYKITPQQFGFLESSFYFMYTPMQLFAGPLIDEFGASKIVPLAVACCLIGSIMSALEINFTILIIARLLIGFGSAFAFIAVLKTASEWLPKHYYPILSGIATGLGSLGGIAAEVFIPMGVQYGAPIIYFGSAVISLVLLLLSCMFIYDKEDHSLTTFNFYRIANDIYAVITRRQIWIIGLVGCFMYTPLQIFIAWAKSFFMQNYQVSEAFSGQLTSMIFWGLVIGAPLNGWLASQTDNKKRLLYVGSAISLICMCLLLVKVWSVSIAALLLFFIGCFVGAQQLVFVFAKDLVPDHLTATSIATTNMIVNLSSYIQPLLGYMLIPETSNPLHYTFSSWQAALSIIPILLVCSLILIMFIEEKEVI